MCICACKMALLNEENSHSKLIYLAVHWLAVLEYSMIVLSSYSWCNLHADNSLYANTQRKQSERWLFMNFLKWRENPTNYLNNGNILKMVKKNGDGKTFTMQHNVMWSKYITDLKLCTLMTSFWIHKNPNKYLRLSHHSYTPYLKL